MNPKKSCCSDVSCLKTGKRPMRSAIKGRDYTKKNKPSLIDDADQTIQRIIDFPAAWSRIDGEIRNILLDTFSYFIHFEIINEETIFIYGIYHIS